MTSEKEELPPSSPDGAIAKKKKKKKPKDGSPSTTTKKKKKKSSSVTADGDPSAKKPKSPKSPKTEEGSSTPTKKKKKKKTSETSKTSSGKKEGKTSSKSRTSRAQDDEKETIQPKDVAIVDAVDTGRDIEEGKAVVAEVVDNTESTIPLADAVGERQADLCCDSCCDVRKATLICDIIYVVVMLALLIVYSAGISEVNGTVTGDDDVVELVRSVVSGLFIGLVVKNVIGILMGGLSIFGALKYKKGFVLATGIWICIDFVANFFFMPWFVGFVLVGFSYPHFALFRALRQGKITAENYHVTEEYCCCSQKNK